MSTASAQRFARVFCLCAGWCLAWVALGCGGRQTPYETAMASAEEARRDERSSQERDHFDQAAQLAERPNDEAEALYRAAQSYVREGRHAEGAAHLESFARTHPKSIRAARAWLDAGRAWEKAGRQERALASYHMVTSRYPESGGALASAKRIVALQQELHGTEPEASWQRLLESNRTKLLDEELRYQLARCLEGASPRQAIAAFEEVARRHPLPQGRYADESLLRAAKLRHNLGDHEGSLLLLELLADQGGRAALVGSYTRSAYVEALIVRGRILRDDLNRPDDARAVFLELVEKYPKSRLVDDALWENVVTSHRHGGDTCRDLRRLEKVAPDSRFVRCESYFCSTETVARQRAECEEWLGSSP